MPPVVVVTRDARGFTHLKCALDVAAAEAEDWVAEVSYARGPSGGLRVDLHDVDDESLDLACAVARDELRMDPRMDLSYLATHRSVDGVLEPLAGSVA
jgi:hypothetical protein